jgi:hypothetical protein
MEVWEEICMTRLYSMPRKVLMFQCTSKKIKFSDSWWAKYFSEHKQYKSKQKGIPCFLLFLDFRLGIHKQVLKLLYRQYCAHCGCRFNHTIRLQFKIRMCDTCQRDNLISDHVLHVVYGIDLKQLLPFKYIIRHMGCVRYSCPNHILSLTSHVLDLSLRGVHNLIFFYKPDVDAIFDLPQCLSVQKEKILKVNLIKSCIRRKYTMLLKENKRHFIKEISSLEIKRTIMNQQTLTKRFPNVPSILVMSRFPNLPPVPFLTDNEFCTRTMIEKFKLDKASVLQKNQLLINKFGTALHHCKIYKYCKKSDVYTVSYSKI